MTYADKERACAKHAGIEPEHKFSKIKIGKREKYVCDTCGYNTFRPEGVKDCCTYPTGASLVEKLEEAMAKLCLPFEVFFTGTKYRIRVNLTRAVEGKKKIKTFINAYYAAFCEGKEKKNEV